MTDNVTPIKKRREKVDTGFRFDLADFTGGEYDNLNLYDSLYTTLRRATGLLGVIGEDMEEDRHRIAIGAVELECRDAHEILDAWWRASNPKKALGGES